MKTRVKIQDGFCIYFEPLDEVQTLRELLPDDNEKQLLDVYNNNVVFCAKVSAELCGIELGVDYLGGCIYESYEDFYTKYRDDYFADMVDNVVKEAKIEVPKIIRELKTIKL